MNSDPPASNDVDPDIRTMSLAATQNKPLEAACITMDEAHHKAYIVQREELATFDLFAGLHEAAEVRFWERLKYAGSVYVAKAQQNLHSWRRGQI